MRSCGRLAGSVLDSSIKPSLSSRSELFQMDKLKLIQETIAMSQNIKSDFLSKTESIFYIDSRILDILLSEFDCMESIVILLEKEKFEIA